MTTKFTFIFVLMAVLLTSCATTEQLKTEHIQNLDLDVKPTLYSNIGQPMKGCIKAKLKDGANYVLQTSVGFETTSDLEIDFDAQTFVINEGIKDYHSNTIPIQLKYTDKSQESISSFDTVQVNFKGNSNLNVNGKNGKDGLSYKDARDPILF